MNLFKTGTKVLNAVAAIGIAASVVWGNSLVYTVEYTLLEQFQAREGERIIASSLYIQVVIDAIRFDAMDKDCEINFLAGNQEHPTALDIGNSGISFENPDLPICPSDPEDPDLICDLVYIPHWGNITLSGSILSENYTHAPSDYEATISIGDGVSVEILANVINNQGAHAVEKSGVGTLTVGGVIFSMSGQAIKSDGAAKIVINETSEVVSLGKPAIIIDSGENDADTVLVINDGVTISVFGSTTFFDSEYISPDMLADTRAILNQSTGAVVIDGGNITGSVVSENNDGDLYINGGQITGIDNSGYGIDNSVRTRSQVPFIKPLRVVETNGNLFMSGSLMITVYYCPLDPSDEEDDEWAPSFVSVICVGAEKLRVMSGFNPNNFYHIFKNDNLGFQEDDIVVLDGKDFINRFRIFGFEAETTYPSSVSYLYVSGNDLLATSNPSSKTSIANKSASKKTAAFAFAGIRNGQINLQVKAGIYGVELYNLQGRLIGRTSINATVGGITATGLRTDALSKGVYILNVKQAGVSVFRQRLSVR